MGKRKRISDQTEIEHPLSCSPSSEAWPCSSEMEVMLDEKPSHSGDPGTLSLQPVLDITDRSMKLLNAHPTMVQYHRSLSRSIFLKRSRHYFGHQYSRRNSASASTSCGKGNSSFDERLSFKLASQSNSESKQHEESQDKAFNRPDRIRSSSSLVKNAVSSDAVKMVCGVCEKPLRWKLGFLGNSLAFNELAVVAVLVCGHVYHAECLEQRTSIEERRDPPCPRCEAEDSGEQEYF